MPTFTTRTEAVNYMVSKGVPRPLARAAVNETYNYENDGDTRDLLYDITDNGPVAIKVRDIDLFNAWETMEAMMRDDKKYIYIDGEPLYHANGDHVNKKVKVSG